MKCKKILYSLFLIGINGCCFANELLIENVTLISPERHKPLKHANIRIIDDQIIEVSTSAILQSKESIKIDGTGQFLIPGLMDSHVHVSNMPGVNNSAKAVALEKKFLQQQPRSYLYFGVTQLLDPSQSEQAIVTFNQSEQKPDLFHCGAAPILGGYPTVWSDEATTLKNKRYLILEQNINITLPKNYDITQHTPEAVVARMAEEGAICVKVFIEDGFGHNNDWPLISKQLLQRVRAAATKHGLMMMAHANAFDMQQIAIASDVDVIAHGMWNWLDFNRQPAIPKDIRILLDEIINKGMIFQPTFSVMDGLKNITINDTMADPLYKKVVSTNALNWYQSKAGQWFKEIVLGDYDNMPLEKIHQNQDRKIFQGEKVVQYLKENGLPMVLASDTPSAPLYVSQPGYSTYKELQHLFKAGLNYKEVLAAATINNAKAFGLDDKYGTVEPGKVANLLLLNQNPLLTIDAYNAIDKVIVKGIAINRESLAVK